MVDIRRFRESDWPAVWALLEPVLRAGDTYSFPADMDERAAHRAWVELPSATYVACDDSDRIVGTYYLKPNQAGPGAHVCNCGYVTGSHAQGRGVASAMCEHSQREAVEQGFRAMQYNMVVSTNEGAVRLWQKLGYDIVGTLPGAFRHPARGYVDAYVMFKTLA